MAEVSDTTIKRTQDVLGKIIKKPVLTEKLLRKPPFKFLHDIIHAVIKTTGFLGGLYTEEELQSENMKDRDMKIVFLQKTIDALKLATKQEVKARPSKIVAGLEADKTNELLIAIAKAIDRKIDSTEAVELVKSGNVNIPPKTTLPKTMRTQAKNEPRRANKETNDSNVPKKLKNTVAESKTTSKSDNMAKLSKQSSRDSTESKKFKMGSSSKSKEKEKKKEREKNTIPEKEKAAEKTAKSESVERKIEAHLTNGYTQSDVIEKAKPNETTVESVDASMEQIDLAKSETEELSNQQVNEKHQTHEREGKSEKREKTPMMHKMSEFKLEEEKIVRESPKVITPLELEPSGSEPPTSSVTTTQETTEKVEKSSSDKPRSSNQRRSHIKPNPEKSVENTKTPEKFTSSKSVDNLIERPLASFNKSNESNKQPKQYTALRSASIRPISARPSAPRRRDRNVRQIIHTESFVQDSGDPNKTDKKNTIPEFDDADNIVITETISDNITAIDEPTANNAEADIDGKQGHLVQQILETQTAILKSDAKNDISAISDESILNDRKSITRNMTELRKMIQKLSLYITPLGKMMEYFQEDVDAMQIELLMWQKAGAAAETDIKGEQRTTEKLLESFKYNLAEINNSIKDHAEQINNTTMNIIQNEERISKLISTL